MAQLLESFAIRTLLGIRFWDPATDRQVSDGLQAVAWPETAPDLKVNAFRTISGNFAFQNLPGMRAYEYPTDEEMTQAARPFIVELHDSYEKFMPIRFDVELPLVENGLYRPTPLSSPIGDEPARFYLFSAPARLATPGLAAIRATLVMQNNKEPAAYALVEVEENGRRWYGLTDSRGCVAILFPYPDFITALGASPPGLPPSQQRWPLTIRVRHDSHLSDVLEEGQLPTIRQISNQPVAPLWGVEIGLPTPQLASELTYGEELILRTGSQSYLWIGSG